MFFPSLFRHITALLLLLSLTPLPLFAAETAPAEKQADEAFEARVSKLLKESRSSPLEETVARVRKGLEGVPPSTPEGQEAVTRYYQRKYQGLKTDVSELHALLEKAAAKGDSEAMVIHGFSGPMKTDQPYNSPPPEHTHPVAFRAFTNIQNCPPHLTPNPRQHQ